jgi:hypothetical protein
MNAGMYVCMYVCMGEVCIGVCVYMHVCMYVYKWDSCICKHIHTYIQTNKHILIHTYIRLEYCWGAGMVCAMNSTCRAQCSEIMDCYSVVVRILALCVCVCVCVCVYIYIYMYIYIYIYI